MTNSIGIPQFIMNPKKFLFSIKLAAFQARGCTETWTLIRLRRKPHVTANPLSENPPGVLLFGRLAFILIIMVVAMV
jgi:hypothetical protein